MLPQKTFLYSTALVSIGLLCVPSSAIAQTTSQSPDTGYSTFVPLATSTKKSFVDGRFVDVATPPVESIAEPVPTPPVVNVDVQETTARIESAVNEAISDVEAQVPQQQVDDVVILETVQEPVAEEDMLVAQNNVPVFASPQIDPRNDFEDSYAAPSVDVTFPEEQEAYQRIVSDTQADMRSTQSQSINDAARAVANLPNVPSDIVMNKPLSDQTISEVAVEGLQRIEPMTVQSYLDVTVGEVLTAESRNQSLKNLYSSGLFSDVAIDQRGSILTVRVVENPQINVVAFEGNKRIEDEELQREIQLRARSIFTSEKAIDDTNRILSLYRRTGRYASSVVPKVIERDDNRVDIAFEIIEGPITDIRDIRFIGNEDFSDSELRSAISSKIARWYRFYASDDRYDPDRFNFDQELLRQFYLENGYADFQVTSALAELTSDQEDFYLTISIDEGARYKIGTINIDNQLPKFDGALLNEDVGFETNDYYNAEKLTNAVDAMISTLGDNQYAFANVTPDVKRNPETQTVDITFTVTPSPKVYVERIDIKGNVRTLDKVVRREFKLAEGDPFNREKLSESERDIRNLGFFKNSDIQIREGSAPDQVIIESTVEEQSTGDISVGGGYSSLDGPLANFAIRERNFLGKGQNLRLGALIAGKRSEVDVGFTEPYFLDRKLSAGVDVFRVTRDLQSESSFDQKRTGLRTRLGYDLSEKWTQSWRVGSENNEITDVEATASRFIRDQEGSRTTTALGHRIQYDTRDSRLNPRDGGIAFLDTELAGITDAKFIKNRLGGTYYVPVFENWTFAQTGEVGNVTAYSGDAEINERFNLGGNNLRGFSSSGVGPRDISTDDALGGNNYYRGSSEVSFPISLDADVPLRGHVFSDYGSLFGIDEAADPNLVDESSLRLSAGIGVSWASPFGPLRIDFANPIIKEDFDEKESITFSFGTAF